MLLLRRQGRLPYPPRWPVGGSRVADCYPSNHDEQSAPCPPVFCRAWHFPRDNAPESRPNGNGCTQFLNGVVCMSSPKHSLKVHVFKFLSGEAQGAIAIVALAVIVLGVVALVGAL